MKKVLLISNAFPPLGGGGVVRPSRIAKYLTDWGWEPIVLTMTVPPAAAALGEPAAKYARYVIRTPRIDLTEYFAAAKRTIAKFRWNRPRTKEQRVPLPGVVATGRQQRLSAYVLVPDNRVLWIPGAIAAGVMAIRRHRPTAIFSMSPDPSAHLVAAVLAAMFRLHWVAEFRDPWMTNPFRSPRPFRWMESFEASLERMVVRRAARVCVTSLEYADDFIRRYPRLRRENVRYIPNGFDPEDFVGVVPHHFDRFTILHAGNFYAARSAGIFLAAYAQMVQRRPELRSRIQVAFVGNVDSAALEAVSRLGLNQDVQLLGQRSHRESIALTCGADILLLVPGPGNGTMPGKTYEYMRSGRPVYCLGSAGPAARLIDSAGIGVTESSEDPLPISRSLENMIDDIMLRRAPFAISAEMLKQFDRREIAGQIATLLEGN